MKINCGLVKLLNLSRKCKAVSMSRARIMIIQLNYLFNSVRREKIYWSIVFLWVDTKTDPIDQLNVRGRTYTHHVSSRLLRDLTLEWWCFDERCRRAEARSRSSVLLSLRTRFQVSWADISPSSSHFRLERSAGDIDTHLNRRETKGKILPGVPKTKQSYLKELEDVSLQHNSSHNKHFAALSVGHRRVDRARSRFKRCLNRMVWTKLEISKSHAWIELVFANRSIYATYWVWFIILWWMPVDFSLGIDCRWNFIVLAWDIHCSCWGRRSELRSADLCSASFEPDSEKPCCCNGSCSCEQ